MNILDLINKKKNKKSFKEEEINYIVENYVNGNIKDYQMSSLLMAITINNMTDEETFYLTNAIIKSGEIIDLSEINGIKIDKHSTGGVGDKTTLVLAPLLASLGFKVPKLSGRALGHTGGTIDKLESIPNFNTELLKKDFISQVNDINLAVISQTNNICLADKKIYALRDVTSTVDSIPLIASSIMSKKIAGGADLIALDVKLGSGAFMKKYNDAYKLGLLMKKIGEYFNKKVIVIITNMDQPLGNSIGNNLEVLEAIDTLKGKGPKDLEELCVTIAYKIYNEYFPNKLTVSDIKNQLYNNEAFTYFNYMVKYQNGNIDNYKNNALYRIEIKSTISGYLSKINTESIGIIANELGAGRNNLDDQIDYDAGIILNKKIGDKINIDDILAVFYSNNKINLNIINNFYESIKTSKYKPKSKEIIIDII